MILKINKSYTPSDVKTVEVMSNYNPSSEWAAFHFNENGYYNADKYSYYDTENLRKDFLFEQKIKDRALEILKKEKINKYIKKLGN